MRLPRDVLNERSSELKGVALLNFATWRVS